MIPVILETLLHESLKYSRQIDEAKWYPYLLIKFPWVKKPHSCEMTASRT